MQDSTTRRAFALDSRATWVESQTDKFGAILHKDNLPAGPGEYTVEFPSWDRHICTPSIGGFRGAADHFPAFKSKRLTGSTPGDNDSFSTKKTFSKYTSSSNSHHGPASTREGRTDFKTIFHDFDGRQGTDPNKGFTKTPGAYDIKSTTAEYINQSGVQKIKATYFDPEPQKKCSRNKIKEAGPVYDVKYDSHILKPRVTLTHFDHKTKRIEIPTFEPSSNKSTDNSINDMDKSLGHSKALLQDSFDASSSSSISHTNSFRASLVPLPKLKKRTPPVIIFDKKSYVREKNYHDLTPSYINQEAKISFFNFIEKIPRRHHSVTFKKSSNNAHSDH